MNTFRMAPLAAGMVLAVAATVAGAGAPSLAAPAAAGDAVKGKATFARCAICHAVQPGVNKLGPSLAGVVGRKAASVPGFAYSPAMKASGIVWTPDQLDAYLAKPSAKVPGTTSAALASCGWATPSIHTWSGLAASG